MPTPYAIQLKHLIAMSRTPALRQHAQHRAEQLEACSTGMWAGMVADLKADMSARKQKESLIEPSNPGKST